MTDEPIEHYDPWAAGKVDEMKVRLARIGATDEEIAEFEEQWLHDPEWSHDDKQRVFALNDVHLARDLAETRIQNRDDRESDVEVERRLDQEDDDAAAFARAAELSAAAAEMAQYSIPQIVKWVGDDADRARASLDHERACAEPRRSLVARLEKQLA